MMRRSNGLFPGGIIIHHSLTADGNLLSNTQAIRKYHVVDKEWDEIGYHYLIERVAGIMQIVTGRAIQFKGAHCPPNDAIGICLVGNFDHRAPRMENLMMLNRLVLGLMVTYGFEPEDIHYHSDYSKKSCPGCKFPKDEFLATIDKEYKKL